MPLVKKPSTKPAEQSRSKAPRQSWQKRYLASRCPLRRHRPSNLPAIDPRYRVTRELVLLTRDEEVFPVGVDAYRVCAMTKNQRPQDDPAEPYESVAKDKSHPNPEDPTP